MKTAVLRFAGKLADAIREMNEAQRLLLVKRTALDRHINHSPDPPG